MLIIVNDNDVQDYDYDVKDVDDDDHDGWDITLPAKSSTLRA